MTRPPILLPAAPTSHGPAASIRSLLQLGVDYYHIPHGGRRREDWEADIKEVVGGQGNETDFLVLARYMQILPGSFLSWYGRSIINIHHGLLPSFKGANPYRQVITTTPLVAVICDHDHRDAT